MKCIEKLFGKSSAFYGRYTLLSLLCSCRGCKNVMNFWHAKWHAKFRKTLLCFHMDVKCTD